MTQRFTLLVVGSIIMLSVGVYHGVATDRWSDPAIEGQMVIKVRKVPDRIGEWVGDAWETDESPEPKTVAISRRYTHSTTGQKVLVSLTLGRGGRVSIHNPEYCYLGSGYKLVDSIKPFSVAGDRDAAKLWTAHFQKKRATSVESVRIYWTWTSDGRWLAPEFPQMRFAGVAELCKLYVLHGVTTHGKEDETNYQTFLRSFLNETTTILTSG
jgi:hypothetical protein